MRHSIKRKPAIPVLRPVRAAGLCALALLAGIIPAMALSFSGDARSTLAPSVNVAPVRVESCLPLLRSAPHAARDEATDRSRRSIGQAAAIAMVFGVRYATAPLQAAMDQPSYSSPALAIAGYRDCVRRHALSRPWESGTQS